jgi:hypothetical protein
VFLSPTIDNSEQVASSKEHVDLPDWMRSLSIIGSIVTTKLQHSTHLIFDSLGSTALQATIVIVVLGGVAYFKDTIVRTAPKPGKQPRRCSN